jgi:uncharacterized protein
MLLGLSGIIDCPGGVVPFETSLDLSRMEFGGSYPLAEPVCAAGQVRNTAGVLVMTGELTTRLHAVCDRCVKTYEQELVIPLEAVLVKDEETDDFENPWTFELDGDQADLDEILTTAVVLNMDSKLLCSEDCKGLCSRCGADLNLGPCNCKPELDPRMAVLQKLLEK